MKRIVVDYDGTLFEKGIYPIENVVNFLLHKQSDYNIVVLTSRKSSRKIETESAVQRLGLIIERYIYGNGVDDPDYKVQEIKKLSNVVLAIDNNIDVLNRYRVLGIKSLEPDQINKELKLMADFKIRFNLETEDVELVLDDKVVDTVGTEVVQSWVSAYNDKHGFVKPELVVEETSTEEVVTESESSDDESEANAEGEISA